MTSIKGTQQTAQDDLVCSVYLVTYSLSCASAGLASGSDQHNGLKQALQPGQDLAASSARLCDHHWQEFQVTNRDELGQVKRLGMAGRSDQMQP